MRKGSKHTIESLAKIKANNARTGKHFIFSPNHLRNLSNANKGKVPWIKGKKQSKSHIEKRVQSRIRNGTMSKVTAPRGEAHYLWKKDRTALQRDYERGTSAHRDWSQNVKKRDGWKCRMSNQDCKGRLEAHHIFGWNARPDLRYQFNNGITLCHFHHPRTRENEKRMAPQFLEMVPNTE